MILENKVYHSQFSDGMSQQKSGTDFRKLLCSKSIMSIVKTSYQ